MNISKFIVYQLLILSSIEYIMQLVIGHLAIAYIEGRWPVVKTWSLKVLCLYLLQKMLLIYSLL